MGVHFMKRIEAIIRPHKAGDACKALLGLASLGMTRLEVKGVGTWSSLRGFGRPLRFLEDFSSIAFPSLHRPVFGHVVAETFPCVLHLYRKEQVRMRTASIEPGRT